MREGSVKAPVIDVIFACNIYFYLFWCISNIYFICNYILYNRLYVIDRA